MFVGNLENITSTMLHLGDIYWGGWLICGSLLIFVALIVIMCILTSTLKHVKLATKCLDACPQGRNIKYFGEIGRKCMLYFNQLL